MLNVVLTFEPRPTSFDLSKATAVGYFRRKHKLFVFQYSGAPLIRSPIGRKHLLNLLTRVSLQENVWSFLSGAQKSGRNNDGVPLY